MGQFYLENRLRYFLYLSTGKVRPLFDQIEPTIRERLSLSLNIKVPFVEAGVANVQPSENDFRMLKVVLAQLDKDGLIGPINSQAPYLAAQLPMRWAYAGDLAYFTGRAGDSLVCMGGSLHHLTQRAADLPSVGALGSTVVGMSEQLETAFADPDQSDASEAGYSIADWAAMATVRTRQPARPIEFVARRIGEEETDISAANWNVHPDFEDLRARISVPIVLATPLYVAEVD